MKTVLITGGLGFIGLNYLLTSRILSGNHVMVVDNLSACYLSEKQIKTRIDMAKTRCGALSTDVIISDLSRWLDEFKGAEPDLVIHLSAVSGVDIALDDPQKTVKCNISDPIQILQRFGDRPLYLFASSGAANLSEQSSCSFYGASKISEEILCSSLGEKIGASLYFLRFSNVYGNWSEHKNSVVNLFCRNLSINQQVCVNHSGEQLRDFIHVDDIVNAIDLLSTKRDTGPSVVSIATGVHTSINQLTKALAIDESKVRRSELLSNETQPTLAPPSKLLGELGWQAKISLERGIAMTVKHYREQEQCFR